MDLMVMVILVAVTGALLLWPLLRRTEFPREDVRRAPDRDREKEMVLATIRELDFDHATGKISSEDYGALRARYEARAVAMITQPASAGPATAAGSGAVEVEAALEAEIAAARREVRCQTCGGVLPRGARFCPACGAPAAVEVGR